MKALLICPADRPAVAHLAENTPLALAPLLGRSVLEYWIEALAARGARHVLVLAADRPNQIRTTLGDGTKWGIKVDVLPQSRELTVTEARTKFRPANAPDWLSEDDVVLLDYLPGRPDLPLFESYSGWLSALQAWMPRAVTPARIGAREIHPGVWVGLHAQIAATAQLHPPCWIGEHALVGPDAVIGPGAILDDRVVVERGARVVQSAIGPETFVGEMTLVLHSLAQGNTLINWQTGSVLRVPDAFLLCSLESRNFVSYTSSVPGRAAALAAMLITAPAALVVMALSLLRGDPPVQLRLGVRAQTRARRGSMETFAYYELTGARNWLRRWPQFWSVLRGDLAWFGNRPLRPTQALALSNDFERLWLAAPPGLVSLADAYGCPEGLSEEACAHASYYAVNSSRRLNWFIVERSFWRAASVWPLRWTRRKETAVRLPQLVPKQQG
jgi:NDP-sugar pyrophosphorylase family protein